MNVAFLITAYDCPNHFGRLVHALGDAPVFVHIDAKSDIAPFHEAAKGSSSIFIRDRIPVHWGEFSVVRAALRLMSEALRCSEKPDYLCMLSGADYPLRDVDFIRRFLEQRDGTEFINLFSMPNDLRGKPISRLGENYRDYLGQLQPFAGGQWGTLSARLCTHILDFVRTQSRIVQFFEDVQIPDESFLHTIIGNSQFRANVAPSLTFADWPAGSAHPAVLEPRHVGLLKSLRVQDLNGRGEYLFGRKFPDESAAIIDQLGPG